MRVHRGIAARMQRAAAVAALVMMTGLLAGCPPQGVRPDLLPEAVERTGPVPSYEDIVERYNANLAGLDQLWSTSVVALRWVDEDGSRQFEQGEGNLLFMRPDRVALTVGKLGNVILWAGANQERYWLLDLRSSGVAYVGRHANIGRPCSQPLPLPVQPGAVPHLLGLLPLDETLAEAAPPVQTVRGHYLIEPPGLRLRMLLHPRTYLPVRVDLLNAEGDSVVVARLNDHERVEVEGLPQGRWPLAATDAELYAVGEDARMSLRLANLTDGRRFNKLNPKAFDFDALLRAYRPEEVVVLDEDCE